MAEVNRKSFSRLSSPGDLPPIPVFIASIFAMAVLFASDVTTPADIRLHVLYVFPLAAIALHCARTSAIVTGLVLSVALQLSTFLHDGLAKGPLITDALVAFSSSVLTVLLARAARDTHLTAVKLATTDWLTGLPNRRSFETIADLEIARQKRYGGVFSLALVDLDDFKGLNDSKGHRAGDEALKLVAAVLQKHTRQSDSIARLGGDEFVVLMPSTQKVDCSSLCQQISRTIADRMAAAGFAITASIGCASFEYAPKSVSDALHRADEAMYFAKTNGKARTSERRRVTGS